MQWNRGTEEDHQAAEAVRSLLKKEIGPLQAVQIGLLNNRRLQAAYQELGVAQAALVEAALLRNPVSDFERRFHAGGDNKAMEFGVDDFLHVLLILRRRKLAAPRELSDDGIRPIKAVEP